MRWLLIFFSVLLPVSVPAEKPVAWQTDPSDKQTDWVVSDSPRDLALTWKLKASIQPGDWVRINGSGIHCLWSYEVSAITANGRNVEIARRFTKEEQNKRWGFYAHNPEVADAQLKFAIPAGAEVEAKGAFKPYKIAGSHFMFRL